VRELVRGRRCESAFLFVQTSQRDRALAFLWRAPPGRVPVKSGRAIIDAGAPFLQSVIVTTCRNGPAD
jgi:hypothetical protein